jgi:FkbM family methyltransferase
MKTIPLNRPTALREGVLLGACKEWLERPFRAIRSKCRYLISHPGVRRSPILTLARLLRWRLQCLVGIPAVLSFPEWGARFYLPPRWHGAGTTMIYALRSSYEKELMYLARFISPGMVVVDGGASAGIYTVAAARFVGLSGLVLSFEPGAEAFSVLRENVLLNGLQNVRIYHAALAEAEGKAALYHHAHGPNSFSLAPAGTQRIEFEQVTTRALSEVAQEEAVERIGLIKLDVEGAEEFVLRGAEQLIANSHPTIILEVNGTAAQRLGLHPTGSWKLLETLGYKFFSLTDSGDLCTLDHVPAEDDVFNIIAIHPKAPK